MSGLHDYGALLLASRLRKISEALYAGVDEVYRRHGVELPSRCFPILFLLREQGRLGISELAAQLGQTHPAVSQMSRKLLQHRVVKEWPDPNDERRRLLGLSRRGAALMARLAPIWNGIIAAVGELEAEQPLSATLTGLDQALTRRGFAGRIDACLKRSEAIDIIRFESRHAKDFKRLNLEWLEKYFRVEPIDVRVLSQPRLLLEDGGAIFLARSGKKIIGTGALIRGEHGRYEVSKMAVTDGFKGLGVGRRLLRAVIDEFTALGGAELFLETNSVLKTAIALYESAGFVHGTCPADSPYARSDVYMVYRG